MFEMVGSEDFLMFATDYPHWDFDSPEQALPHTFPRDLRQKILTTNARRVPSRGFAPHHLRSQNRLGLLLAHRRHRRTSVGRRGREGRIFTDGAGELLRIPELFAGLLNVALIGILVEAAFGLLERHTVFRWGMKSKA
jgi:hypothetical protein